jgi:DTW domain-containing protein YfiP
MHDWLCVCAVLEPLELRTRVVVLAHAVEIAKPTNTGRLVEVALVHGELRIRGRKHEPLATDGLVVPGRRPLLLYPTERALVLDRELVDADPRPITLVIPDGNWRQARKVNTREPALADVQRVRLPEGPPSRYRLRRHADPRRVSTLEAIARALGVIEGPEAQRALEHLFDVMVERTLWTRGELPGSSVTGGLPPRPGGEPR